MADGNFKDLNKKYNQIKFSEIKPLKLQAIQNMMVIKEDYLRWLTNLLIKNLLVVEL